MSDLQKLLIQAERTASRHLHWTFVEDHLLILVAVYETGEITATAPAVAYIMKQALYTVINEAVQRIGDRMSALTEEQLANMEEGDEKERLLALTTFLQAYPSGLTLD